MQLAVFYLVKYFKYMQWNIASSFVDSNSLTPDNATAASSAMFVYEPVDAHPKPPRYFTKSIPFDPLRILRYRGLQIEYALTPLV